MKLSSPTLTFRRLTFSSICLIALVVTAWPLANRWGSSGQTQEAGPTRLAAETGPSMETQEQPTDLLDRLISPKATPKSPDTQGMILPSQIDAAANLLAPGITASKVDMLFTDVDGDGRFDPGDTIEYTVTINNAGPDDATAVKFADTIDANTTLVGGSVNSSPIAFNDTGYSATGNVRITIAAAAGVLVNDIDPDTQNNTGLTASAGATSAQGGNVSMNADGSFTYNPAPGFTGTDTFTYTVTDPSGATGTGTVTFNVSGMIWFIDDTDPTPGGDGRLTNPFQCLVGAGCFDPVAADDPGDNIFLFNGTYTGGLTLLANQRLIGQGAGSPLTGAGSITGLTPPTGSDAVPTTNGNPDNVTITTTVASTNSVTLGTGNTLRGFGIGNTTGGADILGNGFGTLIIGNSTSLDLKLFGTGQALSLTNGTLSDTSGVNGVVSTSSAGAGITLNQVAVSSATAVAFNGVQISGSTTQGIFVNQSTGSFNFGNTTVGTGTASSGGTDAVSLQNNSGGTRTFGTLTIQNNTAVAFLHGVGGGTTTITGATSITNPGTQGINIQDSTTAISFQNVNVTQSGGTGVFLDDNTGVISFADLDIAPDAGQRGLHATDQSAGAITTTSGTITSATNTAVEIVGTSAAIRTPLNITLTTVSSATNAAPNGIILSNTSGTGFSIVGTGSAGSGGTIANKTGGNGSTTQGTGIYLNTVTNVSLSWMQLNDFQNFGIRAFNVNGFTLSNSTINAGAGLFNGNDAGSDEGSVSFDNLTGTVNFTNIFVEDALEANVRIINTTGTLNLTVSGSTFRDTHTTLGLQGLLLQSGVNAGDAANITANITNSNFTNNFARGIQAVHNHGGTMEVNIGTSTAGTGGSFSGNFSSVDIAHNSTGITHFNVKNGIYTVSAANAGPPINIFMGNQSTAGSTFMGRVIGNDITGANNQGHAGISVVGSGAGTMTLAITNNIIDQIAQRGIAVAAGQGSNTVNATITGNTINLLDVNSAEAIFATASVNAADTSTMNATIGGAGALQNNVNSVGGAEIRVEARFGRTFVLPGYAGGAQNTAQVNAFTASNNNINGGTTSSTVGLAPMGQFVGNPPTPTPTNSNARLLEPGDKQSSLSTRGTDLRVTGQRSQAELDLIVGAAPPNETIISGGLFIPMWQPTLITTMKRPASTQSAISSNARYNDVSLAHAPRIRTRAASNTSAQVPSAQEDKRPQEGKSPSSDNLGLFDTAQETKNPQESGGVVGETRAAKKDKGEVSDGVETVTVGGATGFTLPANKATIIKFRVTINTGVLPAFTQVSNQGTVSGSNFANVLTDDPDVVGANQPTVTPIDHTTVAVASDANPSTFGQNVTFTATMTGVPVRASDPPGTVQFKADGNNIGSPVPVVIGTAGDNVSTAQASTSSLSVGTHVITAEYSGGGSGATGYNANIGTLTGGQVVGKGDTTTSVTSSQNPSVFGQPVTFTATVAPVAPASGTPTGTVNFLDGGNPIVGCQNVALQSGQAQCQPGSLSVGNHTISVAYNGDTNFNTSNGNMTGNPQVVNKANTSVGLTSATNPSVFGQTVTFTATIGVTAPGAGTPTGTVQFLDGGNPIAGCTSVGLSGGQAQCMTSALAVGNHTITAQYSGDGNFNTSNGSMTGNPQVVNKADTTVGLTSATNPSVFGQSITFTATVAAAPPGAGSPTGTVTFLDGGNPITGCTNVSLSGGQAQCVTSALTVGNHTITAQYGGDGNFNTSNGSMTGNPQVVNKADATVGLTSATNPSVFGQSVTFTATVAAAPPGAGSPTGTVNFLDGGNPIAGCQNISLSGGQAQCMTSALSVGNHTISGTYNGDGNFNTANGNMTGNPQVVNKADSTTSLTSNINPSVFGQPVTFTATVAAAPPGAGSPTGTVSFLDGGNPITGCQNVTLQSGQAQCQPGSLSVGSHTITAMYNGDGNFNTSLGSMTGNPQVVNKADTTVALTSSQNPAPLGTNITFTATISVTAPGQGTPTGTVQFLDGGNPIAGCTSQPVSGGQAQCMTNALTVGNHTITAQYSGDGSFNTSTGSLTGNPQVITGPPALIPAVGLTRQQGSPATNSQIATVSDDVSSPGNVTVTAITVPPGLTIANIVNTNGTITADLSASCSATIGDNTIVLEATDGKGLDVTANLVVNVTANTAPTLGNYANTAIVLDCKATITPDAAPADNGSIMNVMATSSMGFTGTIMVDQATGVVTISNSGPLGAHTITVTATDNCGAMFSRMFTLTVNPRPIVPTEFDFDGDRKADVSVYRAGATTLDSSFWHVLRSSNNTLQSVQFGNGGDRIVPGDYNGDGTTDFAVFRPSTNTWFTSLDPAMNYGQFVWGAMNDIPVPGFYDADNKTDIAVFRPSTGNWHIAKSTGGSEVRSWGQSGDKVVPADYDGDGKTDLAVWRPSDGLWYIQKSAGGTTVQSWGVSTDLLVPADYDGDGKDDLAVFRPSTGFWFILESSNGFRVQHWGESGDVPAAADFDNDGKADLTVYRPSDGTWYIFRSCPCTLQANQFGIATDQPVPSAFTPPAGP